MTSAISELVAPLSGIPAPVRNVFDYFPKTDDRKFQRRELTSRPATPVDIYQELFVAVQMQRVFADSKTFVDAVPRYAPADILRLYRAFRTRPGFNLRQFVGLYFDVPARQASDYVRSGDASLADHIDQLWPFLSRTATAQGNPSSLLKLPHPYVVPGGRFAELYYWDSYFTMLGLMRSGHLDLVQAMTHNFAYLIETYGYVPNGNRTYYLSRSQPPLFALMVGLCEATGGGPAVKYLSHLRAEHGYWMDGATQLAPGKAHRRVVRLPDGMLLNRYWDDRDTPREEAWYEDVVLASIGKREPSQIYRDLRATAESGWDFSSRWLPDSDAPSTRADTMTTSILPVDLNCFLFALESKISELSALAGETEAAAGFATQAAARHRAIHRWMWYAKEGAYFDVDHVAVRQRRRLTAATVVPLFVGIADAAQAAAVGATVADRLTTVGGLNTTEFESGEQWDRPNGWAPLQWMAIKGFRDCGLHQLADVISNGWLTTVSEIYQRQSKLVEKYSLRQTVLDSSSGGSGGEYPLQDSFGWTNGVTRCLLASR